MLESAGYLFFYLLVALFAWYVLHYASSELSKRPPTEEDMRRLQGRGFLTFSANFRRPLHFVAWATITACMWSAMAGFEWPVPVGLMIAGFAIFAAGIAWVYYLDYWTKR